MEKINGNNATIDKIEKIVKSRNGKYLTVSQYDEINSLMLSNKFDLLNDEENWQNVPSNLRELVEDSELYYGFNESEIKKFLEKVNKLGYTFNYVNVATQDNGEFDHTFKPYALRKMDKGGSIKSKGTFKPLGTVKELGITPKIAGHDMIAKCDCGEKFSYQNSKKNILWQCPECNGMKRISDNIMANGGSVWEKNGFNEYPRTSPQEWENVEWSFNGHSTSFKGKMYFQKGTGFMFIEKENGELYKPKSSNKLFWRKISA